MFYSKLFEAQSIQLYHLELEGGQCDLLKPDPKLDIYIDYYWLLTITASQLNLEVIPDVAVELVLSPDIEAFAAIYLPVNQKFEIPLHGPVRYAGVCFKSANVSDLLHHDLGLLRELVIGVDTIQALNIGSLTRHIQTIKTISDCADLFDSFWLDRLNSPTPSKQRNGTADQRNLLTILQDSVGTSNLHSVCETLDISERQFRRLSGNLFGLSPKKLQNILRLQASLAELLTQKPSLGQDLYYDDSHRIREIKRLTGMTPGEIRRMAELYNRHRDD